MKMEILTAATAAAIALLSLFSVTEGKFRILASLLLGVVLQLRVGGWGMGDGGWGRGGGGGGVYPSRRVAMF